MKRLEIVQSRSSAAMIATALFKEPLTESDILLLQDKFLTNGFQHIQLQNIETGRALIETFLDSMHLYNAVACLTLAHELLPAHVSDVYYELVTSRYIHNNLEQFILDEFYFDFLWIEATSDLLKSDWYQELEHFIIDYKIDQHIPIIVISYQE